MNTRSLVSLITAFGILFQASVAFAAAEPPQDFFENAWQEATNSTNYSFSCIISTSGAKAQADPSRTAEQKTTVNVALQALKRYKSVTKGALLSAGRSLSTMQEKVNTLGILDLMAAGQLTMDQTVLAVKEASKKTLQIVIAGSQTYYKGGDAGWKTFESEEFTGQIFTAVSKDPVSAPLEKSSFAYKNGWKPGSSKAAVYLGALTADGTIKLLTPFMGEELAKTQTPLSTKLFIIGAGHFKKYEVKSKVIIGALSFTVKETCTMNFGKVKVKVPAKATPVDYEAALNEIVALSEFL